MPESETVAERRAAALQLMELALIELEAIEDSLGAMRLQHAIDTVRGDNSGRSTKV